MTRWWTSAAFLGVVALVVGSMVAGETTRDRSTTARQSASSGAWCSLIDATYSSLVGRCGDKGGSGCGTRQSTTLVADDGCTGGSCDDLVADKDCGGCCGDDLLADKDCGGCCGDDLVADKDCGGCCGDDLVADKDCGGCCGDGDIAAVA